MNGLKIVLGLGILAVIGVGAYFIIVNSPSVAVLPTLVGNGTVSSTGTATPLVITPAPTPVPTPIPKPTPTPIPAPTPTPVANSHTLSEVALHNNAQSCWTAISGNVYDLTPFINQHPGGLRAILSLCGIDGTILFLNQHAGQRRPQAELQSLLIGTLR